PWCGYPGFRKGERWQHGSLFRSQSIPEDNFQTDEIQNERQEACCEKSDQNADNLVLITELPNQGNGYQRRSKHQEPEALSDTVQNWFHGRSLDGKVVFTFSVPQFVAGHTLPFLRQRTLSS